MLYIIKYYVPHRAAHTIEVEIITFYTHLRQSYLLLYLYISLLIVLLWGAWGPTQV